MTAELLHEPQSQCCDYVVNCIHALPLHGTRDQLVGWLEHVICLLLLQAVKRQKDSDSGDEDNEEEEDSQR